MVGRDVPSRDKPRQRRREDDPWCAPPSKLWPFKSRGPGLAECACVRVCACTRVRPTPWAPAELRLRGPGQPVWAPDTRGPQRRGRGHRQQPGSPRPLLRLVRHAHVLGVLPLAGGCGGFTGRKGLNEQVVSNQDFLSPAPPGPAPSPAGRTGTGARGCHTSSAGSAPAPPPPRAGPYELWPTMEPWSRWSGGAWPTLWGLPFPLQGAQLLGRPTGPRKPRAVTRVCAVCMGTRV